MTTRQERMAQIAAQQNTEAPIDNFDDLETSEPAVRGQEARDGKEIQTRTRGIFNGTNKKLDVLIKIPGFYLHWINDDKGRVELAQQGGYEFVRSGEVVMPESNKVIDNAPGLDGKIRRLVGSQERGDPMYAYLMKIKQEWRDEDTNQIVQKVRDSEQTLIREGGAEGGGSRIPNSYIPDGRKSAFEIKRPR